ncbi:MAG: hypothetical protein ABFS14_12185 [Gemmatimonadota bacterium]
MATIGIQQIPRLILLAAMVAYAALYAVNPQYLGALNGITEAVHQGGHGIFDEFSEVAGAFGGTIAQLGLPLVITFVLLLAGIRFGAALGTAWLAQNLFSVAGYMSDAADQELTLTAAEAGRHDWNYLLHHFDLLENAELLSGAVHMMGFVALVIAIIAGVRRAIWEEPRHY